MATSDTKMTTDPELAEEIERIVNDWRNFHDPDISLSLSKPKLRQIIAALRRGHERWREVEPGRIFYAWLFDDGSFDWELHAVEKYAREAADAEERTDPPDKIKVIPVRVVHAEPERPPSGEMVMVPREPTEDEKRKIVASLLLQLWITLPQIPVGTMPNYEQAWDIAKSVLSAVEAEGRKS